MGEEATKKRRQQVVGGKPVIDYSLRDIGMKLRELTVLSNETNRAILVLRHEQDERIAALRKEKNLEVFDAGDHYGVVNRAHRHAPSEHQREILNLFDTIERFSERTAANLDTLKRVYEIAIDTRCEFTNWQSQFGEDLMVAYERIVGEWNEEEVAV